MNYNDYPADEEAIKPAGQSKVLQTLVATLIQYLMAQAILKGWFPNELANAAIAHQIADVIVTYTVPASIGLAMYFRRYKSGSRLY